MLKLLNLVLAKFKVVVVLVYFVCVTLPLSACYCIFVCNLYVCTALVRKNGYAIYHEVNKKLHQELLEKNCMSVIKVATMKIRMGTV